MPDDLLIVDEAEFTAMVSARSGPLLDVAAQLAAGDADRALALLTRPVVAFINSHAVQLEELLDAYGALRNERWRPYRRVIAAVKLFSRVHYGLVHLVHASPGYRLLCDENDLNMGLDQACRFTAWVLNVAGQRLSTAGPALGLARSPADICPEVLPEGILARDCPMRHVDDVAETVARLATAFLNQVTPSSPLSRAATTMTTNRKSTELPRENELRVHAEDFHNLQALYDTNVAYTDAERDDTDLMSLRGHASIVYHLVDAATELMHYHERHVASAARATPHPLRIFGDQPGAIEPSHLDWVARDLLVLAARYAQVGRTLAQDLLRRYTRLGEISVPVPRYRGFHVRPSTLVARIAHHYGSPLTMSLEDETYDASSPLELFRANEAINAKKRRWLAREIGSHLDGTEERLAGDLDVTVRPLLARLAEEGKVILYEQPLPSVECKATDGQVLPLVVDAVARLLALGKIDIIATITATFRGDRRVLADVELLAANGYGEDACGNNIPLPEALTYLRK